MESFEGVIAMRVNRAIVSDFCYYLGYPANVTMMYRIPTEGGALVLRKIDSDDAATDMACIGKQNGEAEVYVVSEFHIRLIDGKCESAVASNSCNATEIEEEDDFFVDITFEDVDVADIEEIPVHVEKIKELEKKNQETCQAAEVEQGDADEANDAVNSDSMEGEKFHDSDYDFSEDDDDVIFRTSVVAPYQELGAAMDKLPTGNCQSRNRKAKKEARQAAAPNKKKIRVKATSNSHLHVDEGDQIPVHEESDSMVSDELNSVTDSSDEDSTRKKPKLVRFRPEMDMNDPKFHVGQQFDDKQLFKMAVDNYAVKWGKDIKWVKHDKHRMRVKCKAEHCKWMLFASKIDEGDDSIAIKTMGPAHTCGRTFYHKRATSGFLARKYVDFLRMNKRITVSEFKDKVHAELNVNITKPQVYKTFMKAKILIHGSYKDQYNRLWDYCEELMKANPGSTVYMETTLDKDSGKQRFQRLYICFEALKRGFKSGCRKIIGVDGCHLRGPHPGVLLTAVGIDPNDCVYPVAYAVVEAENKRSWKWFIEFLKYDLSINDQRNWSFISDRQKVNKINLHCLYMFITYI